MSNLSEEEIIEILEDIEITSCNTSILDYNIINKTNKAIQDLIVLYKKEKEKNKEYEEFYNAENKSKILMSNKKLIDIMESQLNYYDSILDKIENDNIVYDWLNVDSLRELRRATFQVIGLIYYQKNLIEKYKIEELREIDNIDFIQYKIKELLEE